MEKKLYDKVKDIRNRIASGQTTTFKERNFMYIVDKKQKKKQTIK